MPKTDFLLVNNPPKNIRTLLQQSCYDCHSNNTEYPWYDKIQPISWFLAHHITDGKEELNFNEWDTFSNRRKNSKIKSIISQIEDDAMPLSSYTIFHGDAKFSKIEKKEVIQWLTQLRENI